ncbi:hypothetical protein [Streptomyces gilvosporeus]|uniref:Uncharacterized protein n=1 Tax=Streptomyces gilvosporeus TaxID=553510 RepID=A0A1V0TJV1_9ACTN|nr:hypothetical protein [Streptomyces gilvosporeus]ARF53211.1 hypothetical protein B1H19_02630 [Streptomyces gilvosporeus]
MVVAQPLPVQGMHTGPFPVGAAAGMLVVGGLVVTASVALSARGSEPKSESKSLRNWLLGLGTTLCVLGGLGLLDHYFETRQTSDGLHAAGRRIIDDAVKEARGCDPSSPEPTFVYPSGSVPGGAATYVPSPCSTSPRDVLLSHSTTVTDRIGYKAEKGDSFSTNGHVTVTDEASGKQVCAIIPDTANGSGSVTDGSCRD